MLTAMTDAEKAMWERIWQLIGWSFFCGGLRIMSVLVESQWTCWVMSAPISDERWGCSLSMIMLMRRICKAFRGSLSVKCVSAAAALLSWKDRKFWMLCDFDLSTIPSQSSVPWDWRQI